MESSPKGVEPQAPGTSDAASVSGAAAGVRSGGGMWRAWDRCQLLRAFLTMAFAATFMGERFGLRGIGVAAFVGATVYFSRKCQINSTHPKS